MIVNNVLAATEELGGAFSPERWGYAGQMTLLGMLMVFSVLAILWAVLAIFKLVFAKSESKEKKKATETVSRNVGAVAPTPVAESAPVASPCGDEELVAILTAAVAAYIESEGQTESYPGGFRVVSFRRVGGGHSWNAK